MSSRATYDFRSDTFTTPTPRMLEAMGTASVGDDVYGEDETTTALLSRMCKLTGKDAALFTPSGTMGNQILVRSNLVYAGPASIVCDDRAHIYRNEAAGLAVLSQAIVYPCVPRNGKYITLEDIQDRVVDYRDVHVPTTKLICLENTLSGVVMPVDEIRRIFEFARENGMRMHLDGARLWNASAESGVSMAEYCQYFDTVSICVSKGLCAPIGSVIVGDKASIERAKYVRKQQGGSMRQTGMLAAAANVGIDEVWPTMKATHTKVKAFARELETELGYKFEVPVETNFIFLDCKRTGLDIAILEEEAQKRGLAVHSNRLAFHYYTSDDGLCKLKEAAKIALERSREARILPTYEQSSSSGFVNSKSGLHKYATKK